MTPPPSAALVLLGLWVCVVFAATNAAGYRQWHTAQTTRAEAVTPGDDTTTSSRRASDRSTGAR